MIHCVVRTPDGIEHKAVLVDVVNVDNIGLRAIVSLRDDEGFLKDVDPTTVRVEKFRPYEEVPTTGNLNRQINNRNMTDHYNRRSWR